MPEKPLVPYQSLKQKQKARIAGWMYPGNAALLSGASANAGGRGI